MNLTVNFGEYLPRYDLFPVFTGTTEIFCTIGLDYQCQASREKEKNLLAFCKWFNSIPSLFSVQKKKNTSTDLTENFLNSIKLKVGLSNSISDGNSEKSYAYRCNYVHVGYLLLVFPCKWHLG